MESTIDINGRVPGGKCLSTNNVAFTLTADDAGKSRNLGIWDPVHPPMVECINKAVEAMKKTEL